jgi:hypothetical protein
MGKRYSLEEFEEYRRQQDERAAKQEEERKERVEKNSARRAWTRDGGSERDFERAWPEMRDAARKRRIMDADQRARASQRGSGVSRI